MKKVLMALAATFAASVAFAQPTPVGLWKTIDDETKTERSLIRITETGGVLGGRIEKLLGADAKQDAVCEECTDDRKGKPIVGMAIIRGVKKNAETEGLWDGGTILDPNNGKTYRARLKPIEGGKALQMRGYLGPFYRTQVWQRVE